MCFMNQQDINNLDWSTYQIDKELRVNDNLYVSLRKSSYNYIIRKSVNYKQQKITLGKHPTLTQKKPGAEPGNISRLTLQAPQLVLS